MTNLEEATKIKTRLTFHLNNSVPIPRYIWVVNIVMCIFLVGENYEKCNYVPNRRNLALLGVIPSVYFFITGSDLFLKNIQG